MVGARVGARFRGNIGPERYSQIYPRDRQLRNRRCPTSRLGTIKGGGAAFAPNPDPAWTHGLCFPGERTRSGLTSEMLEAISE